MTLADEFATVTQSGTAGSTDMIEVMRPDGIGGYAPWFIPLSAVAQLLAAAVAAAVTAGTTDTVTPVGNVLIVPVGCARAIVADPVDIVEVRFANHVTDGVMPATGTELEIVLVAGGSVFGGATFAEGPVSVTIQALGSQWYTKSHS